MPTPSVDPGAQQRTDEPESKSNLDSTVTDRRWHRWMSEKDRALLIATLWLSPVPAVGALIAVLTVGLFITPDGGGYLKMGQVIQEGHLIESWDFSREPGLPFLIRVTALSYLGVPSYLAASGFMAGLAVTFAGGCFFDLGRHWQRLVAGLVAVSASVYISYAGYLMQQTGFALFLALLGWNIRLIQTADGVRPVRLLGLGLVGTLGLYYGSVMRPIVALALLIGAVIVLRRLGRLGRRRRAVALAALLGAIVIPVAVYGPWHWMKAQDDRGAATAGLAGIALPGGYDKVTYVRDRIGTTLLLLQLRGAASVTMVGGYAGTPSEDLLWAGRRSAWPDGDAPCGISDVEPGLKARIPSILGFREYCTPMDGSWYLATTAQPSYLLGGATSLVMVAGTIWAFFRRRDLVPVLLLPWAWVGMYSFTAPIDRYGIPIWPYKIMFATLVLFSFGGWLVAKVRERRSAGTAIGESGVDPVAPAEVP